MSLSISIWSDIACPWCFVGKARLESALGILRQKNNIQDVTIRWRAYELDPSVRDKTIEKEKKPYIERIAAKYGVSVAEAQSRVDVMAGAVRDAGGDCELNKVIAANTFDAHRLIQWAASLETEGSFDSSASRLSDAFMRGYLGHGLDLTLHQSMLEVVETIGLDTDVAGDVLSGDDYAQTVRADEQQAQRYGISGVPFFVIGDYGISGAQDVSVFVEAIKKVNAEILAVGNESN